MACTQHKQLVCFPKVRVQKKWFRYFNDHKDFKNDGTVHLFSLMALFSYANFRSNTRTIANQQYMEAPGQWVCKLSALPRILRVHSKAQAKELLDHFQKHGFLSYEFLDEESGLLRFTIADWKRHCVHLDYNYYSYKGSGFFFFPLPVGRQLLATGRKEGKLVFSELDAIMDFWLHTILNDPTVAGSEHMPVVYYANMKGQPLLSYSYLAKRWGWSKSRVGRFILKIEEAGIISRVSFTSSHGSVISPCRYREMIYGEDCEKLQLLKIGEILGLTNIVAPAENLEDLELKVETRVPKRKPVLDGGKVLRIQVFRAAGSSFFARPVPLVFYGSLDWGRRLDQTANAIIDGAVNDNSILARKIQQLHIFFSLLIPDMSHEERQLLDEALIRTYAGKGITHDNDTLIDPDAPSKYRTMPILEDVYNILIDSPETKRMGNILNRLVHGSAKTFNKQTNVDLSNPYTVLDISELTGDLLTVGMFTVLDYVWDKAKEDRTKEKAIFLDEVWQLIGSASNTLAAEFVLEIFKVIRGFGGSAVCATQDLSDFMALEGGKYGKGIINVSKTKIILNLEDDEAQKVQDTLRLTDAEIMSITRFERGQGLISTNSNHITVEFKASALEKRLITTDRYELSQIVAEAQ